MLSRQRFLILAVVVLGMAATASWLKLQNPLYEASASILLESRGIPSEASGAAQGAEPVTAVHVFTEAEVIRSRQFATELAERLDLFSDPRFNPGLAEAKRATVIDRFLERMGLAEHHDPASIPSETRYSSVLDKLQGLYTVAGSTQHNVIVIRVKQSDPAMTATIANEIAALYLDRQVKAQVDDLDRLIAFMNKRSNEISDNLTRQQTTLTHLIRENQMGGDGAIRALLAEQTNLSRRLANASESQAERIRTRINEIDDELAGHVGAEIKLAEYQLAISTQTSRLEAINRRIDELETQRLTPEPHASQISFAEVPRGPVSPNTESTLAVSVVVFAFLGMVAAFLRESLDNRLLRQEDTEGATGLHVIASLPRIPEFILRRDGRPHECVAKDSFPSYSNAVRSLVSTAMENAKPGRAPVVLVGSAMTGEGKSSIASSMAVAAAMDDLRVLLIDFDVHHLGSTRNFRVRRGTVTFGDVLTDLHLVVSALRKTSHAGVDLMTFSPGSRMSRRAAQTDTARIVFDQLRKTYDLVLVDTPPFLATEEVIRLKPVADGVILVNRWGKTSRDELASTAQQMLRHGLPMIGVATNAISRHSAKSYGYLVYNDDYYNDE